jgi:putative membrane-bound dehydrogenase-like protein
VNAVSPTLFGEPIPPEHQNHIDQYSELVLRALIEVAEAALADRRPAVLKWARGQVGFAQNRRQQGGPVDHQLPVLAVFDPDQKLRAVWTTYACHCVTLSDNKISGDWAGYAAEAIERIYPGCTALISIGCGADANPSSGVAGDRADLAEAQGAEIATEVARLIRTELTPLAAPSGSHYDRIPLPLAPHPTREQWQQRAKRQDADGYYARVQLERLDRGQALLQTVDYPIQSWDFGDQLSITFLPGEVVVDYALRLRQELDGDRLWINAYANHCPGYIPSERVLREGGYEAGGAMVYYDLPGPYAAGLEDRIVHTVTRQLAHLKPERTELPPQNESPPEGDQSRWSREFERAVASCEVPAGFRLELVAHEPLVQSPVAIAFGLDGTLWVAEMFDYPSGVDGKFQPGGRVKRLTDRDGDGRYDHATVFMDGIPFPTGVTVWRDGILVCAAPDILFARDLDDDGRADEVRTLFRGFGTDNYQARVNSLEYGLDGWVYGSCGLFGGEITTASGQHVPLGNRDFRMDPDRVLLEPAVGRTQQGRVRDDGGDWFGCDNGQFVYHYPFPDHYVRRNPFAASNLSARSILTGEHATRVFPISEPTLYRLSGPAGVATAACGLGIYRDRYLGDAFDGNAFTCEPVNNLVTRRVLTEHATGWQAMRSESEQASEIVRSTDLWFRPVQVRTGPDGALWIVDMHRLVIEHPRWIPPETLDNLDVRAGADSGRIYRLVRIDRAPQSMAVGDGSPRGLVEQLGATNGTRRDLATMALTWLSNEESATLVPLVTAQWHKARSPIHRLHLLVVLDAWQQLDANTLLDALRHDSPLVRRHALRLAERRAVDHPELIKSIVVAAKDASPRVRLQAAFTLGEIACESAAEALADLLGDRNEHDEHDDIRAAATTSLNRSNLPAVIRHIVARDPDAPQAVLNELARQAAAAGVAEAALPLLHQTSLQNWLDARDSIDAHGAPDSWPDAETLARVASVFAGSRLGGRSAESLRVQLPRLPQVIDACRSLALNPSAPQHLRQQAISMLGASTLDLERNAQTLLRLLAPQVELPLQQAALAALEQNGEAIAPKAWIESWNSFSPGMRTRLLESMLTRSAWTAELIAALDSGTISAGELSEAHRETILAHPDPAIQTPAARLLAKHPRSPSETASDDLAPHLAALEQLAAADREAGQAVFRQKCAVCHRIGNDGQAVGPDLVNYATKPAASFAVSVARPNEAIDPRYVSYTAATHDGRIYSGIIAQEDANAVVLQAADGKRVTIARHQLEDLRSTGVSLMPEGLARELTPSALRDLWAFIKHAADQPH